MIHTSTTSFEIHRVVGLEQADAGLLVTTAGGRRVLIPADHPLRDQMAHSARASLEHPCHVGIILDGKDHAVELVLADHCRVAFVRDDETGSRREVGFWGPGAMYYLPRDHPEFDRIDATLREAVASKRNVWMANRT